jgi:hypothetical protein
MIARVEYMQAEGRLRLGRLLIDSRSVMAAEAARHGSVLLTHTR